MDTNVFHVDAINEHFTFLNVIVTGNKVDECRLTTATLTDQGDGLTFRHDEVDVLQHPFVGILKRHMAELYLMFERLDVHGVFRILYGNLRLKDFIDTLHRSQALRYAVAGFRELLQRLDDAV